MDPMWDTFRREHPEVTLVLLPQDVAEPNEGERPDPPTHVSREEAEASLATMSRRVDMVISTLGLEKAASKGWQIVDSDTVCPHVQWSQDTQSESTPFDAEALASALTSLGWNPSVKKDSNPLWLDATIGDTFARLVVTDEGLSIRASGLPLLVGQLVVEELRGETHG